MDRPEKFRDRQGREVTLSPERWQHIISGHPEIEVYAADIRRAVEAPTAVLAGREPDEEWLYLEGAGPSRWLKVVVVFDSADQGRIITSFARRRKP
jgi:phage-Barnase-EndoU-ColicinE5/D-RelE like nuclease2